MAFYTNMTSLIQLNSHCHDCIYNVRVALGRMYGVTSVIVDSTYDTVKVTGTANPRDILLVVQSYDIHARLMWSKPTARYSYGYSCFNQNYCDGYNDGYYYKPYYGHQYNSGCNIM